MKTFTSKMGVVLFLLFGITGFAFAQSVETNPTSFLPSDIDVVYQLKTTQNNPFEDALVEAAKNNLTSAKPEEKALMTDLATKLLTDGEIVVGLKMDGNADNSFEPDMYGAFKMSTDDYATLRKLHMPDAKSETYRDITIYSQDKGFSTYLNDWALMTNNIDTLKKMIDAGLDGKNNLINLDAYQKVAANELTGSFFNMYINPTFVTAMYENQSIDSGMDPRMMMESNFLKALFKNDIYKMLDAEGVSVAYNENGFDFSMTVKGNKEELQKAGLDFQKYNFKPSLYKNISGNNLIVYGEKNNLQGRLGDVFNMINLDSPELKDMFTEFNVWKTTFQKDSGINIETDILSLLNKKDLFALHNSNQIYPAATFVMEVNDTQKAGIVLTKFVTYLKKQLEKTEADMGKKFVTYSTPTINGTSFYEFKFNMATLINESEFLILPENMTTLYLRMAVTNDGLLVISNHPDLGSVFRGKDGSMLANQTVSQKLGTLDEQMESVFFMNFAPLNDYIKNVMTAAKAPSSAQTEVDNFMKTFGTFSGKAYSDAAENMMVKGRFEVDSAALGKAASTFFQEFGFGQSGQDMMPMEPPTVEKIFCDVKSTDDSYASILYLKEQKVIMGYPDGCFYPKKTVNRAEFITMLMRGVELNKTLKAGTENQLFKDVKKEAWHFSKINKAVANNLVKGFGDGTFHPENAVTRAEALQMLYNASSTLQKSAPYLQQGDSNFYTDAKSSDWFYKALAASFNEGLLDNLWNDNSKKFMPNKAITREEAAKLIHELTWMQIFEKDNSTLTENEVLTPLPASPATAPTRLTEEGYNQMQSDFTPIKVSTPDDVTNKNEASTSVNYVMSYNSSLGVEAACTNQVKYLTSWNPSSLGPKPVMTDDSWVQVFEKDNVMLTLACVKNPNQKDKTMVAISESVNIQNY